VNYWVILLNAIHQASNSFTYKISNSSFSSNISAGASKWSGTVTISLNLTSAQGTITDYTDPNSSINAYATDYVSDSKGHFTNWGIYLNKSNMIFRTNAANDTTLAHEFGHAIGLRDLTASSNSNKLMYGYANTRTVSSPQSADITGAKEATK